MAPEIDKETLQQWHKVLAAEDCREAKRLLEKDKRLLNQVWEANGQPSVRLDLLDAEKGRTGLHIAAKRGSIELVEKILSLAADGTYEALGEHQGALSDSTNLPRLLRIVDGAYDLNALAMAVVNGNKKIVSLLTKASLRCETNPYDIAEYEHEYEYGENMAAQSGQMPPEGTALHQLDSISEITELVLSEETDKSRKKIERMYYQHCHFNFLPISLYLFHFTFAKWPSTANEGHLIDRIRTKIFSSVWKLDHVRPVLFSGLWDGQGRTPLHVAVDSDKVPQFRYLVMSAEKEYPDLAVTTSKFLSDILNAHDSAGRTPLFRAAAKNRVGAVRELLEDSRVSLDAGLECSVNQWAEGLDIDQLSWCSYFNSDSVFVPEDMIGRTGLNSASSYADPVETLMAISTSPLHIAIIHKHEHVVKMIVEKLIQTSVAVFRVFCSRRITWPVESRTSSFEVESAQRNAGDISEVRAGRMPSSSIHVVSTMQLAVLAGSIPILQILLKAQEKKPNFFSWPEVEEELPSFLLAAATGKPSTIKAFLNSQKGKFDPRGKDRYMNTALHHALKGRDVKIHPHLLDFVGCDHVFIWRWNSDGRLSSWIANPHERRQWRRAAEEAYSLELKENQGQRHASILLLLQAGVDILAQNNLLQTASPDPNAPQEFVKWWYEKEVQETQQMQKSLNDAANAISVTAALVATASFVGPLQPPLSYGGAPVGLLVEDISVRIFIVCDTLSFYFALAAIMLALLPALPKRQQPAFQLLMRTRLLVAGSVAFLFPSIICVLIAFGASSIAVIRGGGFSHHRFTIITVILGGVFCLRTMISFMDGLLDVLETLIPDKKSDWGKFFMELLLLHYVSSIYTNVLSIYIKVKKAVTGAPMMEGPVMTEDSVMSRAPMMEGPIMSESPITPMIESARLSDGSSIEAITIVSDNTRYSSY